MEYPACGIDRYRHYDSLRVGFEIQAVLAMRRGGKLPRSRKRLATQRGRRPAGSLLLPANAVRSRAIPHRAHRSGSARSGGGYSVYGWLRRTCQLRTGVSNRLETHGLQSLNPFQRGTRDPSYGASGPCDGAQRITMSKIGETGLSSCAPAGSRAYLSDRTRNGHHKASGKAARRPLTSIREEARKRVFAGSRC